MLCANKFCKYWKANECTLEEIELDICGICKSCIYLDFSEKELEIKRTKQLKTDEIIFINSDITITETADEIIDENIEAFLELAEGFCDKQKDLP